MDEKNEVKKYIGEQIRALRNERKITQKELGKMLGLKNNTISSIERGVNSITPDLILKVAEIFNIRADDLFPPIEYDYNSTDDLFRYAIRNTNLEAKDVLIFKELIEKTNLMTESQRKKYIDNLCFVANYFVEQNEIKIEE